jgi:hypothetical protein
MHLVMNDVLSIDVIEFTLPRTPLASGALHCSMEENMKAVFELLGLELITYGVATRVTVINNNEAKVVFRLTGDLWSRRNEG